MENNYLSNEGEDVLGFVRRVVAKQSNPEPLHIVEQLVEIVVSELKDRPCKASIIASEKGMKVTLRHEGKPIDSRMIRLMDDHTDHVDYYHDGDTGWKLVITREIPPLFAQKRKN